MLPFRPRPLHTQRAGTKLNFPPHRHKYKHTHRHTLTEIHTHTGRRSSTGSPFQPFSILLHFQLPSGTPPPLLLTPHCPLILLSFSADCLRHLAFMWSRRDAASRLAEHAPGHNRVSPPTLPHSPSPTAFYFCLALLPSPVNHFSTLIFFINFTLAANNLRPQRGRPKNVDPTRPTLVKWRRAGAAAAEAAAAKAAAAASTPSTRTNPMAPVILIINFIVLCVHRSLLYSSLRRLL